MSVMMPRLALPGDAPALALMSRDLIEVGLGWQYRSARIRDLIQDAQTVAIVVGELARPVGFAIMSFGDERAHLVLLAVLPSYQRQGLARRMIRWLVESAVVAGIASLHVELRIANQAAYALYRSLEFVETLRVPRYYGGSEEAIRMMRLLRLPGLAGRGFRPPTLDRR